jgi:hypothetical protein
MKTLTADRVTMSFGHFDGRPVEFSQAFWRWTYADTPAHRPVEFVTGQFRVVWN